MGCDGFTDPSSRCCDSKRLAEWLSAEAAAIRRCCIENDNDGYTTIHVEPRTWFRLFGGAFALLAWNTLVYCMQTGGPHGVYVRSWAAIEDQFLCHAAGHALAGTSWDLEGHRYPTNNVGTWVDTRCNW